MTGEHILVYLFAAFVLGVAALAWRAVTRVIASYEAREKNLLSMIRNLENRIHAKDLSGYIALKESETPRPASSNPYEPGSDEHEAYAEAERNGTTNLFARENG